MEVIIEVLGRHGRVNERIRARGPDVTIGRSYRSDVIVSDPYVCPQHLRLHYDHEENGWRVQDLLTQNGSFLVGKGRLPYPYRLESGDEFELGQTRIRILLPEHEVAATRPLPTGRVLADYFAMPMTAIGLLVATLGIYAFIQYLGQGTETKLQELLLEGLMFLVVPFLWACVWGLIGRIAVHEARFSYHLSMGTLLVLIVFLVAVAADFIGFGFSSEAMARWIRDIAEGVLLTAFLLASLLLATGMTRRGRWILASSLAWGVIGLAVLIHVVKSDPYDLQRGQRFNLKPPFAQFRTAVSLDEFMRDADATFAKLDQQQKQDQ